MVDGLGLWLRRARENRQLSLGDVEHALKIRIRYLQALEVGDYTTLPGMVAFSSGTISVKGHDEISIPPT